RAKDKANQTRCLSNLKQLSYGMLMYINDNQDVTPGCASANTFGYEVEDWIYWRNQPGFPPVTQSPIVAGLGSANSNLFKCPMDRDDSERLKNPGANGPYFYSYSVISLADATSNHGFTSEIDKASGICHRFKLAWVKNPVL